MSEILIINNQIQTSSAAIAVQSQLADQFAELLRLGQILKAQLVVMDNTFWLVTENYKIAIPRETVEQWNLVDNQPVKLKVISLTNPLQLQLLSNKQTGLSPGSQILPLSQLDLALPSTKHSLVSDKALINSNDQKPDSNASKLLQLMNNILPASNLTKSNLENESTTKLVNKTSDLAQLPLNQVKPIAAAVTEAIEIPQGTRLNHAQKNSMPIQPVIDNTVSDKTKSTSAKDSNSLNLQSSSVQAFSLQAAPSQPRSIQTTQSIQSSTNQQALPSTQSAIQSSAIQPELTANQLESNKKSSRVASLEAMKFEIPISLPDKERFPLLSDIMTTTYIKKLVVQQPLTKSLNNLLTQLQRLNQWSADNKASRRTQTGSQVEKLVSGLKESLKDMFRYISQKDNIATAKNVQKAIHQSGIFLEKRISKLQDNQKAITSNSKPTPELTIHKDNKANLNRVLATALYNLAKLSTATTKTSSTSSNTSVPTTSDQSKSLGTSSTDKTQATQKQALDNSALLKSNLLNTIRTNLMKFSTGRSSQINIAELELITKEVLKNTQSALARTQLNQLTNLRPDTSAQQWLFELPVMNNKELDIFSLYLKQHTNRDEDESSKKPGWSIVLQFDIGSLGKIRAMLSWENNAVKIRFIAENDISYEQLTVEQAQLQELSFQFSKTDDEGLL